MLNTGRIGGLQGEKTACFIHQMNFTLKMRNGPPGLKQWALTQSYGNALFTLRVNPPLFHAH